MQFDRNKLKAAIIYTCARCEPSELGAVKLHKVLYFADMLRYVQSGKPLTGATYRKRPLGPTCDQLLPVLRELEQAGSLHIREVDYFGYRKKEYIALAPPEIDRFSSDEQNLLDEVIEFVCGRNTARTISEYSHNAAWESAEFGDVLPYRSAFRMFPVEVPLDALEWAEKEADAIEASKRSQAGTLESRCFRDFRSRVFQARRSV